MMRDRKKTNTFGFTMRNHSPQTISTSVVIWLCLGLFMVYMQIVIGGITRLTGSGLSITEWEIVTGTLPPLTDEAWQLEFAKYKGTPQFEKINRDMEMGSIFTEGTFKFIYFWEYLHRLWARTMGFVFIIPFFIFFFQKKLPGSLIKRLGVVILLAALAATFGWIMVASGLIERPWVNAYKLALHLCIGISVFIALWWAFIKYCHPHRIVPKIHTPSYVKWMLILLIVQIFLGGVMSGTKAALLVNTWPDLNGEMIPKQIFQGSNWNYQNFNEYEQSSFLVTLIQFFHRGLAYIITAIAGFILVQFLKAKDEDKKIHKTYLVFAGLIGVQVIIGIITLVKSIGVIPVSWGVLHQAVAVLVLSAFVLHYFYVKYGTISTSE